MSGDQIRAVIVAGVIRNGRLTDSDKRHDLALEDYDGRPAVLVVLPSAIGIRPGAAMLHAAAGELESSATSLEEDQAR